MQYEVTPRELTLAICIPTNREEFESQLQQTDRHDYVSSIAMRYPGLSPDALWSFVSPTISVCNYVTREAEALGAVVFKGFGSSHFQEVLAGRRVITIVAHWRSDHGKPSGRIELADGLMSVEEFIARVPQDFNGVLDLTVCNSVVLGNAIKQVRPEITVAMNRRTASARNRLVMYLAILKALNREPQLYGDAMVEARKFFLRGRK